MLALSVFSQFANDSNISHVPQLVDAIPYIEKIAWNHHCNRGPTSPLRLESSTYKTVQETLTSWINLNGPDVSVAKIPPWSVFGGQDLFGRIPNLQPFQGHVSFLTMQPVGQVTYAILKYSIYLMVNKQFEHRIKLGIFPKQGWT